MKARRRISGTFVLPDRPALVRGMFATYFWCNTDGLWSTETTQGHIYGEFSGERFQLGGLPCEAGNVLMASEHCLGVAEVPAGTEDLANVTVELQKPAELRANVSLGQRFVECTVKGTRQGPATMGLSFRAGAQGRHIAPRVPPGTYEVYALVSPAALVRAELKSGVLPQSILVHGSVPLQVTAAGAIRFFSLRLADSCVVYARHSPGTAIRDLSTNTVLQQEVALGGSAISVGVFAPGRHMLQLDGPEQRTVEVDATGAVVSVDL